MKFKTENIKIFLILILYASSIYGQGIIKGSVTDSLSADQLKGAEIILAGTNFSTFSNIDGEFNITGIPAGDYILQASYLGYKKKKILVTIKPEKPLTLNIKLLPVITVEDKNTLAEQAKIQAEEINLQVSSNTIENVVAGRKLRDMPDENIPVALSRLPGVSIMYNSVPSPFYGYDYWFEGFASYILTTPLSDFTLPEDPAARVLIRGLDSRYYNVTINGIRIPPSEDKNIDMNNLSERDFQNIEVHKTITSDEDGDATAGDINMIAGKAPYKRMIKVEALGNYNKLDKSRNQYNFIGTYGERFFGDKLGIRAYADIEKKIMSSEFQNSYEDYWWFNSSYIHAVRNKNEADLLLDYVTPGGGSITFHNIFNKTNTDNFKSVAASTQVEYSDSIVNFSDKKTEQVLLLSSLAGSNHVFGLDVHWNAAFSESRDDNPYNYTLSFVNANHNINLDHAFDIPTKSYSKEKTLSLDIHKKYALSNEITGELKLGWKYRINSRSYFENSHLERAKPRPRLMYFQDIPFDTRTGLGNFSIPLINEDSLRSWRQSTISQYDSVNGADINSYDISQSVSAAYLMHIFNFRGFAIFITGFRIESEHNDYSGYSYPYIIPYDRPGGIISQYTLYNTLPEKTRTFHYDKTTVLPNFQMILKPTGYMNLRLAAYQTLIRPSIAARIPKYIAVLDGGMGLQYLNMGNPDLKNADVWNYEFQLQFHGNDIGQFTIDAFYKDIEGMVQATNGMMLAELSPLNSLGIYWNNYVDQTPDLPSSHGRRINLFSYFNSPKPTRIWGFEVSHQANLRYLPGLLKNIVLNYNFTLLRSETWTKEMSTVIYSSSFDGVPDYKSLIMDKSNKLSDMPEFFANANLGYDIDGFSFRISYFYRDEYQMYYNPLYYHVPVLSYVKRNSFSRLDIAIRQRILKHIFINLSLNNITNSKEEALIKNPPWQSFPNWKTAQAYRYGMNIDFGVGIEL